MFQTDSSMRLEIVCPLEWSLILHKNSQLASTGHNSYQILQTHANLYSNVHVFQNLFHNTYKLPAAMLN